MRPGTSLARSTPRKLCVTTHTFRRIQVGPNADPDRLFPQPLEANASHCKTLLPPSTRAETSNTNCAHTSGLFFFFKIKNWIFEVVFQKCQSCLISSQDVVFAIRIVVVFSSILGYLHFPEVFCFLSLLRLLYPQPCSFLCRPHITLPSLLHRCL